MPDRMPHELRPMMARAGSLPPDDDRYGHEVKWDGVRTIAYCDAGNVRLQGRNLSDFTPRYPEVRALGEALGRRRLVLDGEVVAFDPLGRPSFERLQARMHLASESAVARRLHDLPVTYVIFDLLWLEGRSTMPLAYADRRALLAELELGGPAWRTPAYHRGDGGAVLAATREQGLEGVVAKRLDSAYEPGRRGSAWVKVKNQCRQDFVVGGFTRGEGGRSASLGALALGTYDGDRLVYAGKVGTGFTDATLALLTRELHPLRAEATPFTGRQPPRGTVPVRPRLVVEVEFREWTAAGTLRAASFKGLRADVDPREVVREPQLPARVEGPEAPDE